MTASATTAMEARMQGLTPAQVQSMQAAARAIRDGQIPHATSSLQRLLAQTGPHPELLRMLAIAHLHARCPDLSRQTLQQALALRPDDALLHSDLGNVHDVMGHADAALESWRRATTLGPNEPMPWFNLGRQLQLLGMTTEAVSALERACALAPDLLPATILLGDALTHLGRFDEAQARYRAALALYPACGDAWRGLANIKTHPLDDADRATLARLLVNSGTPQTDRIAMGHALGKAEEDAGHYPRAFAAIAKANALTRARAPWSLAALEGFIDNALEATRHLPPPRDPALGHGIVFIVGMPRSGSTLFEQILAAHPQVQGAGELPDLGVLIQHESLRRQQHYPHWSKHATTDDWHRLGHDYLQRTARWRTQRPCMVDKMPDNWKHAGVLRAMLPGATVLDVRRDPVETGWSCFKQQFYQLPHFACDLSDIGAYLRGCERAMAAWRERAPKQIHLFRYETLLDAPEDTIRALLDTCGLSFDPACLEFHTTQRSVRTASAAQVRQPLRGDTARADRYDALLDPLRAALAG